MTDHTPDADRSPVVDALLRRSSVMLATYERRQNPVVVPGTVTLIRDLAAEVERLDDLAADMVETMRRMEEKLHDRSGVGE